MEKKDDGWKGYNRPQSSCIWPEPKLLLMSRQYGGELGMAHTWRMYSWHSAWYCRSHRLPPESPLPPAPSSKSYTPVLWKGKGKKCGVKYEAESYCAPICVSEVSGCSSTLSEKFIIQWGYRYRQATCIFARHSWLAGDATSSLSLCILAFQSFEFSLFHSLLTAEIPKYVKYKNMK